MNHNSMETAENTLTWSSSRRPGPDYVLNLNGNVMASLGFQGLGSLAIGEYSSSKISLKRGGFLHPYISIRKLDIDTDLAILRFHYSILRFRGELEFVDGRKFLLKKPEQMDMFWSFSHPDGRILCKFTYLKRVKGPTGSFYPLSDRPNDPESLQLAIIGWYAALIIQREQEELGWI
jgi:hypothetical protein